MIKLNTLIEINSGKKYYRAVKDYSGKQTIFEPKGYYEEINNDGNPIFHYGEHTVSNTKEISASKYIGGAVLGAFSMLRGKINTVFIYKLNETPEKDISHWTHDDFAYLEEVRFRKSINGIYIGKVRYTTEMKELFNSFYEIISLYDGATENDYTEEMLDFKKKYLFDDNNNYQEPPNNKFFKYLKTIEAVK